MSFLLIDKPQDWTSFDVCNKVKKIFNIKRVGHTGTLDPFATGLLVIAIGKTTKLIPYLEKASKTYTAEIWLGRTSETLDPESEVIILNTQIPQFDILELEKKLQQQFLGKTEQIPPKYSALKQNGKRLYQLAREGQEVVIPSRETQIHELRVMAQEDFKISVEITAQAGFYVRSFARDVSEFLELGEGMCGALRRTKVGDLEVSQALSWENTTSEALIPPTQIIPFPVITIDEKRYQDFTHGRAFDAGVLPEGDHFFIKTETQFLGLGIRNNRDWIQPKIKMIP